MSDTILFLVLELMTLVVGGWLVFVCVFQKGRDDADNVMRPRNVVTFIVFLILTALVANSWLNIVMLLGAPFSLWNYLVSDTAFGVQKSQQLAIVVFPRILDIFWLMVAIVLVYRIRDEVGGMLDRWRCRPRGWCWVAFLGVLISLLQSLLSIGNLLARMAMNFVNWEATTPFIVFIAWHLGANFLVAIIAVMLYWKWLQE